MENSSKRKIVDPHLNQDPSPTLTEFPPYKTLAQPRDLQGEVGSSSIGESTQPRILATGFTSSEWDEPFILQLEELLLSKVQMIFEDAIKQIVEHGYGEDVAVRAISRRALYRGGDIVSNVVNDTVELLKKGMSVPPGDIVFVNLQYLVQFTMVEMVNVLREVKPSFSTSEAMWWMLVCDIDLSQACLLDEEVMSTSLIEMYKKICSSSLTSQLTSEVQSSKSSLMSPKQPNIPMSTTNNPQSYLPKTMKFGNVSNLPNNGNPLSLKSQTAKKGTFSTMTKSSALAEKVKTSWKAHKKKEHANQQKIHLQKESKLSSNSRNGTAGGGSTVKNRIKTSANISTSPLKTKSKAETLSADMSCDILANTSSSSPASTSSESAKSLMNEIVLANSASNTNSIVSIETKSSVFFEMSDYYAGIPYDKSLGMYVPQDEKDDMILKLAFQVQELQMQVKSHTEWANQKVMQAAQRLSKDIVELKTLREEKQEVKQFMEERKEWEENALKRMSEMELAIQHATGQMNKIGLTLKNREKENSLLKKQCEAAKSQATKSDANYQQTSDRERKAQKDVQSLENEKALLQEELATKKTEVAELQQDVDKAKALLNRVEARLKQEMKERENLAVQVDHIKREREELQDTLKLEEDEMKIKADNDMKMCMEDMRRLEMEIAEMNLKSDALRIAALRRSVDEVYGSVRKGKGKKKMGSGSNKKGIRECVMCLSEEISVVFMPCAHMVLCKTCNELHEKRGMKGCPSCRAPIHHRLPVSFLPLDEAPLRKVMC